MGRRRPAAGAAAAPSTRPKPVSVSTPSSTSITPTANSIARPSRGGMTTPNRMMAPPTTRIVSVCPIPQAAPISAEPRSERCRLTIVAIAITWSASVAWRIPRNKPSRSNEARSMPAPDIRAAPPRMTRCRRLIEHPTARLAIPCTARKRILSCQTAAACGGGPRCAVGRARCPHRSERRLSRNPCSSSMTTHRQRRPPTHRPPN